MAFDYRAPLSLTLCARFLAKQSCSSLFLPSSSCRLRLGDGELLALRSPESKLCSRVSGPFASRAFSSEKKTSARSVKAYDRLHGEIAVVTGDSWHDNVLCSDIPVLVEFWASWCGPCRMVHRELEDIAREYDGKIKCFMLKVDNDLEVADNYSVKAVPVVMLFKNGEKQSSVTGTMPKDFYVAEIEKLFAP